MAMVQGVEGMKMGIKAFKGLKASIMATSVAQKLFGQGTKVATVGMRIFNAVVKANPLFALIGIITAVVGAFAWLMSDSEDLTEKTDALSNAYDQLSSSMDRVNDRRKALADTQMRILKATGASEEELRATRLKNLKEDEKARLEDLALQKATLEEGKKLYKEAKEAEDDEAARAAKEIIQKARDKYHTLKNMEGQYNASVLEELKSTNEKIIAQAEKLVKKAEQREAERLAKYKTFLQDKEAARKQIEDLTNQAIQDETARAEAVALTKRDRDLAAVKGTEEQKAKLRELIEQDYQNTLTKIAEKGIKERQKLEEDAAKVLAKAKEDFSMEEENLSEIIRQAGQSDRQNEIDALNDHYFNLIETAKQHNLDVTALEQEQADKLASIDKKSADEKKANEKEVLDAKLSMASDTFGALGSLATAFAKDDEKSAERAFKINKAVGIAQAVISTAQGVINAYANPVDVASGVAFGKSAIIAATGAAQIATIAKSKFQGGGAASAGSSPNAPSGTAPSASSQPASFNVVGNTGVNQLAETLGNQGQQPIQAFVVGSEVTTQQSLDRNKVETATL